MIRNRLFRSLRRLRKNELFHLRNSLLGRVQRGYKHVMDIEEQKIVQETQREYDLTNSRLAQHTDRVYTPSEQIELNRIGEIVLYTAAPLRDRVVYFKYPYVVFESMIPMLCYLWYMNPFEFTTGVQNAMVWTCFLLAFPRVWFLKSFTKRVEKLTLLRGGKVVKVESGSYYGDKNTAWVQTHQLRPVSEDFMDFDSRDNAEFLDEAGQLRYELCVEADNFMFRGDTAQNESLFFIQEGTVHQPELFEAAVKGYNIDTSDFVINTAHDDRVLEPNFNN